MHYIADYAMANYKSFYRFLILNRLPAPINICDFLCCSVKILEFPKNYSWASVLRYDDGYQIIQQAYVYAWGKDHSKFHKAMSVPHLAP